jgi:GDP/UDP-N,N'-diacetylbacillosamine 2-epimerase (hydrolysing)
MPNADAMGSVFRKEISQLKKEFPEQVLCIENFGKENYFSAMYYAKILIGNTSSGILEAASFGKYVINVGDRQKGRMQSKNCIDTPFLKLKMSNAIHKALALGTFEGENVYRKPNTSKLIMTILN